MKSFNIIRYLKKWWPLIALMSFCAGVFFMRYATTNQAYTAQSIIKYNYSQAEDGKTPSGGELDVSEIFSSSVVKQAIENLDLTVNVDTIRSGGTVTPIVPDDVAKTQAAKIEKGEDVEEYQSTEYLVTLSLSSNYDTEYARTMLDEILSCYFASFGEKYVDYYTIPNNASALDGHGYDYLEQAEILKTPFPRSPPTSSTARNRTRSSSLPTPGCLSRTCSMSTTTSATLRSPISSPRFWAAS